MKRLLLSCLLILLVLGACSPSTPTPQAVSTTAAQVQSATPAPTEEATSAPTEEATDALTQEAIVALTEEATTAVTEEATTAVTQEATSAATEEATAALTEEATTAATEEATLEPTEEATTAATEEATLEPTEEATIAATEEATTEPTEEATGEPTEEATRVLVAGAKTPADICAAAVPAAAPATRTFTAPEQVLEAGVDYRAVFCTDAGPVYVDLLEDYAPLAVNSFVFLADQGYFNDTTFHRVIEDFMAQGGDPTATGSGGPGYQFANEDVGFLHFDQPGWLAMANAGRNTNGSQFFITTEAYPSLNYNYTIFGEVLEGQENVENINVRDPGTATEPGTALNTVVIVTDPSTVETTYVPPADLAREEAQALLDTVNSQIPPSLLLDSEHTGVYDTDFVAQTAPDALRTDYADFLAEHEHEFRVAHRLTNGTCDLQSIPYMAISVTFDRFATPEDAAAALDDDFYGQMAEANGYTPTEVEGMDNPVYTQPRTACEVDATDAMTMWQRGNYVVTVQALFPADSEASADLLLRRLVGINYESLFSDLLRPEIR